jgi:putative glutathione S-transferase
VFQNLNGFGSYSFDDVSLSPYKPEKYQFVRDFYTAEDTKYTVPILWDTKTETIVSNESSEIIQILNSAFNEFAENPKLDFAPESLAKEMEEVDSWTYEGINNGVYKCGFS